MEIKDDEATVHPTRLCNKWYMKIYHVRNQDLDEVTQSIVDVFNVDPHCQNCNVCRQYMHNKQQEISRANLSTIVVNNKNILKESTKKHGFEVYSELQETLFGPLGNRNTSIVVKKTLVLNTDRTWHLNIFERFVPAAYKITLYGILNVNIAESIFSVLSKANICKGNSDFQDLNKYNIKVAGPSHFQSPC